MDYEHGLQQLRPYVEGDKEAFLKYALLEARLRSNWQEEIHGRTLETAANESKIIDQLNRIAYEYAQLSFIDLCLDRTTINTEKASAPREDDRSNANHIHIYQSNEVQFLTSSPLREQVLVLYSHKDFFYFEQLRAYLAGDLQTGRIGSWDDAITHPQALWKLEVKRAIQLAHTVVLLISQNFLGSELFRKEIIPQLVVSGRIGAITILNIIVKPCFFEETELAYFYPINSSTKPLNTLPTDKQEEVWLDVMKALKSK